MNVHFGVVKKYFPQKGFGFVTHPLDSKTRQDVFFHIRNVQKFNRDIADKLSSYEANDDIYFYYEAENTPKGEQVKSALPTDGIGELLKDNLHDFTQKLECLWRNIETAHPVWLCGVTRDLIGTDGLNKLKIETESLKKEKKEAEELKRKEIERIKEEKQKQLELQERLRKIEAEERERQRKIEDEEQERQQKIEDEEFELLVAEMKPKGFAKSAQVSNYIIKHRLGDKYKNISGILEMENNGSSWKFNGGFPPRIYAKLCKEIGLGNEGTYSKVVGFTPFKDL